MIKISGPKKEIDGFIDGDTLCFPNVNTTYDYQEIGYTKDAQLVRVQIEIETEPDRKVSNVSDLWMQKIWN